MGKNVLNYRIGVMNNGFHVMNNTRQSFMKGESVPVMPDHRSDRGRGNDKFPLHPAPAVEQEEEFAIPKCAGKISFVHPSSILRISFVYPFYMLSISKRYTKDIESIYEQWTNNGGTMEKLWLPYGQLSVGKKSGVSWNIRFIAIPQNAPGRQAGEETADREERHTLKAGRFACINNAKLSFYLTGSGILRDRR